MTLVIFIDQLITSGIWECSQQSVFRDHLFLKALVRFRYRKSFRRKEANSFAPTEPITGQKSSIVGYARVSCY